eukprot:gene26051-29426_t
MMRLCLAQRPITAAPDGQRVVFAQLHRQQRLRQVLVAHRTQEAVDRARADRGAAAVGGGRERAAVHHGGGYFHAGREAVCQDAADFTLQHRQQRLRVGVIAFVQLQRLRHYTGTLPAYFQKFVLFTNYQFYIDEFIKLGHEIMGRSAQGDDDYVAFVEPGNLVLRRAGAPSEPGDELGSPLPRLPQMPAYHLVREDCSGITMVNIGVGPANAKTITDHIAVLRPHAWMMLGHCAGLRNTQQLGDYVLAHAYVREDHVLDEELPLWVPIPALSEIQLALEQAVADVTKCEGPELKKIMRTGTVASTDNRNWELLPGNQPQRRFSQSRAVALDMESATIAANGFRFRVPYGTLLCVSDKPLHGEIKLPGMANHFYRERVEQHLRIGMRAIEILRQEGSTRLHSRKLRSFAEVAFQQSETNMPHPTALPPSPGRRRFHAWLGAMAVLGTGAVRAAEPQLTAKLRIVIPANEGGGWDQTARSLQAVMLPPWRSTMRRTVARPMPVPSNSLAMCRRWNGWNSLAARAMSKPAPLSLTQKRGCCPPDSCEYTRICASGVRA